MKTKNILTLAILTIAITAGTLLLLDSPAGERVSSVIVQGGDLASASKAVESVGGEITHELGIIRSVAVLVTPSQRDRLEGIPGLRIHGNQSVEVAKKPIKIKPGDEPDLGTVYPTLVGAQLLHAEGVTGRDVTVAVLDTGWDNFGAFSLDTAGEWRVLDSYDAIQDVIVGLPWRGPVYYPASWGENDSNGHATHIMSIMLSGGNTNYEVPRRVFTTASLPTRIW